MKAQLQRQLTIRNLVSQNKVTSQEQLLMLLKRKGFNLTQATLSRDIRSLKIVKTPELHGGYIYILPKEQEDSRNRNVVSGSNFLADGFLSVDFSGNMAVIKTKPAYASSIAAVVDGAATYEILGTIAGDDTIFIVLREGVEKADMILFLEKIIPNLKGKLI